MAQNDVVKLRAGAVQREANPTERSFQNLDSILPARQLQLHVRHPSLSLKPSPWLPLWKMRSCRRRRTDLGTFRRRLISKRSFPTEPRRESGSAER